MSWWERQITKSIGAYSETEVNTGQKWIDGKPIYRKVIDVGALPAASTTKNVAHGIVYDYIVWYGGVAKRSSDGKILRIPHISNTTGYHMGCDINTTNIQMYTASANLSAFDGYVILEYTK